jgi:hypothetical protein
MKRNQRAGLSIDPTVKASTKAHSQKTKNETAEIAEERRGKILDLSQSVQSAQSADRSSEILSADFSD